MEIARKLHGCLQWAMEEDVERFSLKQQRRIMFDDDGLKVELHFTLRNFFNEKLPFFYYSNTSIMLQHGCIGFALDTIKWMFEHHRHIHLEASTTGEKKSRKWKLSPASDLEQLFKAPLLFVSSIFHSGPRETANNMSSIRDECSWWMGGKELKVFLII